MTHRTLIVWILILISGATATAEPAYQAPQVGKVLHDVSLVNHHGEPVQLTDFLGKTILMSFIFTRCPMPSMCPLLTSKMVQIQRSIPPALDDDVVFLSITFDPEYDTPEVLREYGRQYGVREQNWQFLTGDPEVIRALTDQVELIYEELGEGMIGHNMKTLVVDPKGIIRALYHGSSWDAKEVLNLLYQTASEQV